MLLTGAMKRSSKREKLLKVSISFRGWKIMTNDRAM